VQIEPRRAEGAVLAKDGVPVFLRAESQASGEYHCADCGYGVTVRRILPVCPMCRGRSWEDAATSPFARSRG
jgi:rubrerythrin